MKRTILAAGLLATTFAIPAYAIDVHILADGEVRAILGTPPGETAANLVVGIQEDAVAPTEVTLPAEGGATTNVTATSEIIGWHVFTEDGIDFGAVVGVAVANDGEALLVIDLNDGWVAGIDSIAIRASAVVRTAEGLEIDDTEAELKVNLGGPTEAVLATPPVTPAP